MAFEIIVTSGDSFSYSSNVALDTASNTVSWTANAFLTTLDLNDIFVENVEVGMLNASLQFINSNTPNNINYTLKLTANSATTYGWIAGATNPLERVLYMFTKFSSNTGNVSHANTIILRVRASIDS